MTVQMIVWAACACLAPPSPVMDRTSQEDLTRSAASVEGTLLSTGNLSIAIETDAGKRRSFIVDNQTVMPADLKAGDRVTVHYESLGETRYLATVVVPLRPSGPRREARLMLLECRADRARAA